MSLKTYDRKGQVWAMQHGSGTQTTFVVLGTQGRVKKHKLIVYHIITSQDGRVWLSTLSDSLGSRWETNSQMKRIV